MELGTAEKLSSFISSEIRPCMLVSRTTIVSLQENLGGFLTFLLLDISTFEDIIVLKKVKNLHWEEENILQVHFKRCSLQLHKISFK